MGVRGLASYFSHRELFFEESVLGDCRVVIDGDNLRCTRVYFKAEEQKWGLL